MKKINVQLMKKEVVGNMSAADFKEVSFELPDYIIGVGVISAIDDYLEENNLDDEWKLLAYTESEVK